MRASGARGKAVDEVDDAAVAGEEDDAEECAAVCFWEESVSCEV